MSNTVRWGVSPVLAAPQPLEVTFCRCVAAASQPHQRVTSWSRPPSWRADLLALVEVRVQVMGSQEGCVRVSVEGVQQTAYQCQRSTAAWQEHGCLTVCIHDTKITMPIHPREGFKEAIQMSRWWALPFPLISLLWQNQLFAGVGHWNVFCSVWFLCYYCISVN